MPIGMAVDLSWIESAEIKEVGEFKKGWYRVLCSKVSPPVDEKGGQAAIPLQFKIQSEEGGYKDEMVFHRLRAPGGSPADVDQGKLRLWRKDLKGFLAAFFPKGVDLAKADLDKCEGVQVYAFLEAGTEYQGERRPQVVPGRWATKLPEGHTEGPQSA